MPPFIKDDIKKKDEQRLEEMQREIDEVTSAEEEASPLVDNPPPEVKTGPKSKINAYADIYKQTAVNTAPPPEGTGDSALGEDIADVDGNVATAGASEEIEKLTAELKETDSSLKRLRADFENYRRRTVKEKEDLSSFVTANLIKDLLPLVDNFERAMGSDDNDPAAFRQGIAMIAGQLGEILAKNGLAVINTKGAKFDPNYHQAVMRVENPDVEDGTIVAELQKGYMVKDRVIRPAMVQVAGN